MNNPSTKEEYIRVLTELIMPLPEQERSEILYDFQEHFNMGEAEGKSEMDIISELGSPPEIARDILANYHLDRAESDRSVSNITKAVFASISLSLFNLIFFVGPLIVVLGIYIGLCLLSVAFIIGSIGFLIFIMADFSQILFKLFCSLASGGIGVLLGISMKYLGISIYNGLLKYIKMNVRIAKGGRL